MEPDRFQQNQKYYIIGIFCLIVSLCLFALSFYMLPYLVFNWHYTVPEFIPLWLSQMQDSYQLSQTSASWLVFVCLFLPAIVFAIIADVLSNRIDEEIHHLNAEQKRLKPKIYSAERNESQNLVFKIIVIIIVVFIAAEFFQWIISSPPPSY